MKQIIHQIKPITLFRQPSGFPQLTNLSSRKMSLQFSRQEYKANAIFSLNSEKVKKKTLKFKTTDFETINLNMVGLPFVPLGDNSQQGLTPLVTPNNKKANGNKSSSRKPSIFIKNKKKGKISTVRQP